MMKTNTVKFTCSDCGEMFDSGWNAEQAAAQLRLLFLDGGSSESIVCRPCYERYPKETETELPLLEDFS